MAGLFDDIKKTGDFLDAKEDWNKVAQFLNSLMKMSSSNLNVSMGLNTCSIELPNGMRASEMRIAKLTGAGTLNSGSGTYKAEELFLDKTDVNAWLWNLREDDHLKWNTADIGNSTTITTFIDDLYEINGTTGIADDTIVIALKVDRLVNDKDNQTNYQWLFMIGGGSGYNGPYASRKDSASDENVEIGFNRKVFNSDDAAILRVTDNLQLGFNNEQYTDPDLVLTTFNDGIIYIEITAALAYSYQQQEVTNLATSVVLQETGFLRFEICRYRKRDSIITNVYQIQRGPIHYPGSAL